MSLTLNLNDVCTIAGASIALGCLVGYLLTAWNSTPLPIYISRLFATCIRWKNSELSEVHERSQWTAWSHLVFPEALAHWLNCPVCQAPWPIFATFLSLWLAGAMSLAHALVAAPIALMIAVRLTHAPTPPVAASRRPSMVQFPDERVPARGPILPPGPYAGQEPQQSELGVTEVTRPNSKQAALSKHASGLLAFQDEFGLRMQKTTETGGYQLDASSVTPEMKKLLLFFIPNEPCWFAGCEDLRAQYKREFDAVGGENCSSCASGELTRKYLLRLKKEYPEALNATSTSNPGN